MALLFLEGFDKYGPANSNSTTVAALLTAGEWTTASGTFTIVAPLSATGNAVNLSTSGTLTKTLAANYARLMGGVRFSSTLAANTGIEFRDSGTAQAGIRINTTGTISICNGGAMAGSILATSATSVTANSTHYLEWDITFTNTTGPYQVWLDGASILSGTGDMTATANNYANVLVPITTGSGNLTLDDLYLFDTTGATNNAVLLTSPRIETQFPTGDGAVQFAVGAAIVGSSASRTVGVQSMTANQMRLRPVIPAINCTINSVAFLPSSTNASIQLRPVVYNDNAGLPNTLLSAGSTVTGITSGVPRTMPLTTPQALIAGTQYWVGMMNDITLGSSLSGLDGSFTDRTVNATFASGAPGTASGTATTTSTVVWGTVTTAASNWYSVGQNPAQGAQSYVFEATVGEEDLYTYPALSAPPSAIYAVAVKASVAKSDAGAKTVSVRMKSGATDSVGTGGTQAPGTSYGWLTSHYPTDPATSAAWTLSALNAAQAGVKVES